MDPAWPVLIIVAVGMAVPCVLWFGKRHVERARQSLEKANAIIQKIKGTLKSYVVTGNYIPENVRQPLDVELVQLRDRSLPAVTRLLRRVRDASLS